MKEKTTKSILKYPGSKWKISEWIISHFPEHRVYLEPFFGSGAVFFNKQPAYIETINDINKDVVNLFKVCREHPKKLAELIELTPFSRQEFQDCLEPSDNQIEQARRTLVRYHQSFGTSNSSRKSWKFTTVAGGPRCATIWNYLPQSIISGIERLRNTQIECTDALKLIPFYNDSNTLIYVDPPYLRSLRKDYLYKAEMSDEEHIKLLDILINSKSKVVISGYDNELYNSKLKNWNSDVCPTTTQNGKKRIEKIWYNYENQNYAFTLI